MAWSAKVIDVARSGAQASVTVDFTDGTVTTREVLLVQDPANLPLVVAARIASYTQTDALIKAPPVGPVTLPAAPTQAQLDAAAAQQQFSDDLRLFRQIQAGVTLGLIDPADPRVATLKTSLTTRITATPAFVKLIPIGALA